MLRRGGWGASDGGEVVGHVGESSQAHVGRGRLGREVVSRLQHRPLHWRGPARDHVEAGWRPKAAALNEHELKFVVRRLLHNLYLRKTGTNYDLY